MKNVIKMLCICVALSLPYHGQSQKLKRVVKPQSRVLNAKKSVKITSPQNQQGVKSPLTVKGTSAPKSDINLQIVAKYTGGDQDLGSFTITSDSQGKWSSTPINLWLPEGAKNAQFEIIAAVPGNRDQDKITVTPPSNVKLIARKDFEQVQMKDVALKKATISKGLLEALKAIAPKLTSPTPNAQVSSPLIVKGTGLKNAPIEVTVHSQYSGGTQDLGVFRTTSDANGKWQTIPINLWAPDGVKNLKYLISATQFDDDKGTSRAAQVTAVPKQGHIMVLNAPTQIAHAKVKPKLTKVHKKPEIQPVDLGPVKKPIIASPQNGSVSTDGRFQIVGTGTPGHTAKTEVDVAYFSKRKKQRKQFLFSAQVDKDGIWSTDLKNYQLPNDAYDIKYTIKSHQIRPEDRKTAMSDEIIISQSIASPKLTKFSYKEPDFATTGTGQVINSITGKVYKDHVYVNGEGGAGLKVKVSVRTVRDGKEAGGRTGIVEVDSRGKWKWDTGWKHSKKIDSFVIKMTQSNPGDEADKSETVVEYRTK